MTEATVQPSAAPVSGSAPGPQRYGRYILIDRLGAGGMAEVFRALVIGPEQFQRMVVVKRILPQLSANPGFIQMFIDEATLCGRLSHPNVIQVHEFGKFDGQYFISMEHVQGRNLSQIMGRLAQEQVLLPPPVAAEITRQMCLGLAYAHGLTAVDGKPLGIIHRDVSPGNVMVAYTGAVKVLDFGIARVANQFRIGTTDPGHVKGKSAYLAPEQVTGQPFDHRADVFAAGILLHEMLSARRLFKANSAAEAMVMIKEAPIPKPSQFNVRVPARLEAIAMRALRRDPAERYQSAAEMADALEGFLLEQRFSSQELPKFMRGLFKDESSLDQVHLSQEQLQALMEESRRVKTSPEKTGELPPPTPVTDDLPGPSLLTQWPEVEAAEDPPPDGRRKRLMIVAGVAGAAIAAVVLIIATGGEKPSPAPAVAVAPKVQPVAAPVAAPAPPREVKISITSEPAEALVFQGDGAEPVGTTPVTITLPRGEVPVEFRISKPGYVHGSLRVVPDGDKPALVTLAKGEPAAPPPAAPPRPKRKNNSQKVRNAIPIDPFAP